VVIRAKQLRIMTPVLEGILSKVTAEEPDLEAGRNMVAGKRTAWL
jgi:hypothetical protein